MEWIALVVDYGIIEILVVMSVIAFGVAIERAITCRQIRSDAYAEIKKMEFHLTRKLI